MAKGRTGNRRGESDVFQNFCRCDPGRYSSESGFRIFLSDLSQESFRQIDGQFADGSYWVVGGVVFDAFSGLVSGLHPTPPSFAWVVRTLYLLRYFVETSLGVLMYSFVHSAASVSFVSSRSKSIALNSSVVFRIMLMYVPCTLR